MKNNETDIIQAIWNDPKEHHAFLADPKEYLLERGQEIPKGTEVKVYEDTGNRVIFLCYPKQFN